jgi:glycosyltransferase 2 family protein
LTIFVVALAAAWLLYGDAMLAWLGQFEWSKFTGAFRQFDPAWLAAANGLIVLTYVGRAVRWAALIQPICPRPRYWLLLRAQITGFSAVALLGRAGELVRPYLIANQHGLSFSSQMAVWFLERIFDLLAVLLLFGYALFYIDPSTASEVGPRLGWVLRTGGLVAGGVALVACSIIVAFRFFAEKSRSQLNYALHALPVTMHGRIGGTVDAFLDGISSMKTNRQILLVLLYSFLEWIVIVAVFYCLFRGFPPTAHLSLNDAMVAVGFIAFGGIVQIPGVGGGMQVVTVLILTELYGLEVEPATVMAIVAWITTFLVVVPAGLIFAVNDGLNWRKIKELKPTE